MLVVKTYVAIYVTAVVNNMQWKKDAKANMPLFSSN